MPNVTPAELIGVPAGVGSCYDGQVQQDPDEGARTRNEKDGSHTSNLVGRSLQWIGSYSYFPA